MVHDKNEFVCDNKSIWKDIKMRAEIQCTLWRAVVNLRSGRFYEEAGSMLLHALDKCKFYRYEALDIVHSGDEGDIIRRLLSVFSFKPIYVQTLPIAQQNYLSMVTPFTNLDLYNGEMDVLPIVNLRLNRLDTNDVYLDNVLNTFEVFFDSNNNLLVPKMTKIVNTKGVLFIYVHRKNYALRLNKFEGPFTFRDLPVTDRALYEVNPTKVHTTEILTINNSDYVLRSVVCIKTIAIANNKEVIQGSEALIKPLATSRSVDPSRYLVYDPAGVNTYAFDPVTNVRSLEPPIQTTIWVDTANPERSAEARAAAKGVVYVYTKIEEPSSTAC
jgi:hypothetical protein